MKKTMLMMFRDDLSTPAKQLQYGSFEQTECVTLPIWSTEGDGRWSNERNLLQYYDSVEYPEYPNVTALHASAKLQKQWYGMQIDYRCKVRPDQSQEVTFKSGQVLAPQPYIGTILKRIIEALGYTLADSDNALRDPRNWLSNVFIANARGDVNYAHILPHWTVSQFFQEVQRFFGVVITQTLPRAAPVSSTSATSTRRQQPLRLNNRSTTSPRPRTATPNRLTRPLARCATHCRTRET